MATLSKHRINALQILSNGLGLVTEMNPMSTPKTQPFLSPGRQTWNAPVTNWQGKRSNKSLGTKDVSEARAICRELNDLAKSQLLPDDPALSLVSPIAYKLYYDREKFIRLSGDAAPITSPLNRDEANEMLAELVALRKRVKELEGIETKYTSLKNSIEGKRLEAEENSPTIAEVRDPYTEDVKHLNRQGRTARTWFDRFAIFIGEDTLVASITAGQLDNFIKAQAADSGDYQKATKTRAEITRFFGWIARTYSLPTPLEQLPKLQHKATPDIDWHTLEEVEQAMSGQSCYWQGIIAVLAYAGLSAHELRGLRREDIIDLGKKKGRFLRIAPHAGRTLKSANRKRSVMISPRLAPYFDAYLATLPEDAVYVFPAEAGTDETGLWADGTFSRHLGEHLPKGMDALSLRRTFGSLLIRAGRNEVEVAAAMGNTPTMVRRHYARILGGEVSTKF